MSRQIVPLSNYAFLYEIDTRLKNILHDVLNGNNNYEIILIDDITTTGTTLHACKEILIENGADPSRILCYALARTRR